MERWRLRSFQANRNLTTGVSNVTPGLLSETAEV
jgi:hypothetical protein